jgi:tRNA(fMet)-specific endonuclease VapC
MATSTLLLDSSILIEFFRKHDKAKTILFQLTAHYSFCVSVITSFEFQVGIKTVRQQQEYETLMANIQILSIDAACIDEAVSIFKRLKSQNSQVELADLLIGATATRYQLSLATLNQKHFARIPNLTLLDLSPHQS